MNLERTLETQRVRLLRLLAGWIAVLGVLSFGPVALPMPRWVRAFFDRVLIRAELAAQFLMRAIALTQATSGLVTQTPMARTERRMAVDVPSAQMLLRRMKALRDVLEDLPRYARRLLRVWNTAGEAIDFSAPPCLIPANGTLAMVSADWVQPRIERPPDKRMIALIGLAHLSPSFPIGAEGAGMCVPTVRFRYRPSVPRQREAAH